MKILACFKILPNPDRILPEDWAHFSLSADLGYAGEDFNCFDQSALELGLRLKDQMLEQGTEVSCSALTLGRMPDPSFSERLYAVGYDRVLQIPAQAREFCPEAVAEALAEAAEGYDIVLTGQEAGMAQTGMVPWLLARRLKVSIAGHVEQALWDRRLVLHCRDDRGLLQKTAETPIVLSVGNSPAVLRVPTLRRRMQCRGMAPECLPIPFREAEQELRLRRPEVGRSCTMLDPEKPETYSLIRRLLQPVEKHSSVASEETAVPQAIHRAVETGALRLLPDTEAGRLRAVRLAEQEHRSCFFGGQLLGVSDTGVRICKRVFGSNLSWDLELPFPAVLTRGELKEDPELPLPGIREEAILEPAQETGLGTAWAVVICGSGMGNRAGCDRARAAAAKMHAGFGLTRPAALNHWGSTQEIVGQSGAMLACGCCLILGAAGAGAFLQGVEKTKTLVAVNTDPHALIFKSADYGILMDAGTFLERFSQEEPL